MADADASYHFEHLPRFLPKLEEGYDLVMGNRFSGCFEPGAMPPLHRYLGNPVLSSIGRIFFRIPVRAEYRKLPDSEFAGNRMS